MTARSPAELLRGALWMSAEPLMVLAAIGAAGTRTAPVGTQQLDPFSWVPLLYLLAVLVASAHLLNLLWAQRLAVIPLSIGLKFTAGLLVLAVVMFPIITIAIGFCFLMLFQLLDLGATWVAVLAGNETASATPMFHAQALYFAATCAVVASALTGLIRQAIQNWIARAAAGLAELRRVHYGTAMSLAVAVPHLQLLTDASAWVVFASAATAGSLALSIGSWLRVGHMALPRSAMATVALLLVSICICAFGGWATAWRFL